MFREELAREGDLLLGEIQDADKVIRRDFCPREAYARLKGIFETIASGEIVEGRDEVGAFGV